MADNTGNTDKMEDRVRQVEHKQVSQDEVINHLYRSIEKIEETLERLVDVQKEANQIRTELTGLHNQIEKYESRQLECFEHINHIKVNTPNQVDARLRELEDKVSRHTGGITMGKMVVGMVGSGLAAFLATIAASLAT